MNLDHLKNFLVLTDHMSFTKAAEHLYIVQSTLSRQIRSLEEQIGTRLIIRDSHSLRLTEAGILLVSEGSKLLQQIEQLELRVRKLGEDEIPSLTMVSLPVTLESFSRLYMNYRKLYPGVQFTLLFREVGEISSLVVSGDGDFGLTYSFELEDISDLNEEIEVFSIGRDHLCVITNNSHEFASSGHCTIEALRRERVLYFDNFGINHIKRQNVYNRLTPIDESLPVSKTRETMLLQIKAGEGVALLPYDEAKRIGPDFTVVKIDNYILEHEIILFWKKVNKNPALRLFINSLKESG